MDKNTIHGNYISKYIDLLNNLHNDANVLAPLKVSILCSQRINSSQINKDKLKELDIHCQNCFTLWKRGNFIVKTRKCQQKSKKKSSFLTIIRCKVCSNVTSSEFNKTKILCKSTKKMPKCLNVPTIEDVSSTIKDEYFESTKKPIRKKKKKPYAGLNPLVFKNRDLCKNKVI